MKPLTLFLLALLATICTSEKLKFTPEEDLDSPDYDYTELNEDSDVQSDFYFQSFFSRLYHKVKHGLFHEIHKVIAAINKPSKPIKKAQANDKLPPILLIPGIVGSVLEAKLDKKTSPHWTCYSHSDWFKIWMSADVLLPLEGDCWIDNMKLDYAPLTKGGAHNTTGVQIRAPHFGNPRGSVDYLDPGDSKWSSLGTYFGYMVDTFVNSYGYVTGENLVAAPYDWRIAPNHAGDRYCHKTKHLIERTYQNSGGQKVTIVAHSMGNLFFYYCSKKLWSHEFKSKHIHGYVSIAAPWGGAPKALKMITSGENWGIPMLRPNKLRIAERTWASTYFLLPNPHIIPKGDSKVTPIVKIDGSRNYTTAQYQDFFRDLEAKRTDQHISQGMYTDYSGEHLLGPIQALGFRTICAFGVGLNTVSRLRWAKASRFPDYVPYEETVGGDGTVPEWSSGDVCKTWRSQQKEKVEILPLPGIAHMNTLWDPKVYDAVANMVGLSPKKMRGKRQQPSGVDKVIEEITNL